MKLSEAYTDAYLSIGSNIGERAENIFRSVDCIKNVDGIKSVKISSLYETEPVGYSEQPNFLNCAAKIKTSLSPENLLIQLQLIENVIFERKRDIRWGPRVIDLDILLFGSLVIETPLLTIPHPEMGERLFVLVPLSEIAADVIHPLNGKSVNALLNGRKWSEKAVKIKGASIK